MTTREEREIKTGRWRLKCGCLRFGLHSRRCRQQRKAEPRELTEAEQLLLEHKALAKRLKTEEMTRPQMQALARQLPILMGYLCLPIRYAAVNTSNWWLVDALYQGFIRAYGLFDLWTRIVMPVFIVGGAVLGAAFNAWMFFNYESQFYEWDYYTMGATMILLLTVAAGISVPYSIARKFFRSWAPVLVVQYDDKASPDPEMLGVLSLPRLYFAGDDEYFVGSSLHSGAKGGHIMMMTNRRNPLRKPDGGGATYKEILGEACEDHVIVTRGCEDCVQGFAPLDPAMLTGGRPRYSGNNSRILFAEVMECFEFGRFLAGKKQQTFAQHFKTFAPWYMVIAMIIGIIVVLAMGTSAEV